MIDSTKQTNEKTQEGKGESVDELYLEMEDLELCTLIDKRIESVREENANLERVGNENENYWLGKQIDRKKLRDFKSRIVENVIFQSIETVVPIITSRTPEPVVQSAQPTEPSMKLSKQIQKVLMHKFDRDKLKGKFQMIARLHQLNRIGILKYRYDQETDDIVTEYVRKQNVILDKHGEWVAEFLEEPISEILKKFPDKTNEIIKEFGLRAEFDREGNYDPTTLDSKALATKVKYIEFWTADYVCWKYKRTVFGKMKNPNFDYRGVEKEIADENGQVVNTELYFYNYFDKPKIPYIFLNAFNLGKTIWDDTSLTEQGIPLQDAINKRLRQIDDNASDNGVLMGSGDYITKEELAKYVGDPEDKLWTEHGNPAEGISRLAPKQQPAYVYDSYLGLKSSVDNVLGVHSTTRGERQGKETLGGRQILREADFGRIDLLVRGLEQVADELYKAWVHMMKVYFTQAHYERILGKEGAQEVIEYSRDSIEDGIEISVKEGSTLPVDKVSQRAEALELAQMGQIDPITLFEKLDWPDPRESAKRFFLWKTKPMALFPELAEQLGEEGKEEKHNYTTIIKFELLPPQVQQQLLAEHLNITAPIQDPASVAQEEIVRLDSGENVPPYQQADEAHLTVHDAYMKGPKFEVLTPVIQGLHQAHFQQELQIVQEGGQGEAAAGNQAQTPNLPEGSSGE